MLAEQAQCRQNGRAVPANVLHDADRLAPAHRLPAPYRRLDGKVGRPQAACVEHGDHAPLGERSGIADDPRSCRSNLSAGRRGEIDAPMPAQPRLRRRCEASDHLGLPGERPLPAGGGARGALSWLISLVMACGPAVPGYGEQQCGQQSSDPKGAKRFHAPEDGGLTGRERTERDLWTGDMGLWTNEPVFPRSASA